MKCAFVKRANDCKRNPLLSNFRVIGALNPLLCAHSCSNRTGEIIGCFDSWPQLRRLFPQSLSIFYASPFAEKICLTNISVRRYMILAIILFYWQWCATWTILASLFLSPVTSFGSKRRTYLYEGSLEREHQRMCLKWSRQKTSGSFVKAQYAHIYLATVRYGLTRPGRGCDVEIDFSPSSIESSRGDQWQPLYKVYNMHRGMNPLKLAETVSRARGLSRLRAVVVVWSSRSYSNHRPLFNKRWIMSQSLELTDGWTLVFVMKRDDRPLVSRFLFLKKVRHVERVRCLARCRRLLWLIRPCTYGEHSVSRRFDSLEWIRSTWVADSFVCENTMGNRVLIDGIEVKGSDFQATYLNIKWSIEM